MARGHNTYKGSYLHRSKNRPYSYQTRSERSSACRNNSFNYRHYIDKVNVCLQKGNVYLRKAYNVVNERYALVVTVLLLSLLSFLLQDISYKIHKTKELTAMKAAVDIMAKEVSKAEVACLTAADDVCSLQDILKHDEDKDTVSISPQIQEIFQYATKTARGAVNWSQCKSKKKSVYFANSSYQPGTRPEKKSPSCPLSTAIRSQIKKAQN